MKLGHWLFLISLQDAMPLKHAQLETPPPLKKSVHIEGHKQGTGHSSPRQRNDGSFIWGMNKNTCRFFF